MQKMSKKMTSKECGICMSLMKLFNSILFDKPSNSVLLKMTIIVYTSWSDFLHTELAILFKILEIRQHPLLQECLKISVHNLLMVNLVSTFATKVWIPQEAA